MDSLFGTFYVSSIYEPISVLSSQKKWAARRKLLKTELKKTTALLKKFKNLSASNTEAIKIAINTLNLQKFMDEIIRLLANQKMNNQNMKHTVLVIGLFHERYEKFVFRFVTFFVNKFYAALNDSSISVEEKVWGATLLFELYLHGIVWDPQQMENFVDKVKSGSNFEANDIALGTAVAVVAVIVTCHITVSQAITNKILEGITFARKVETDRISGLAKLRELLCSSSHDIFQKTSNFADNYHRHVLRGLKIYRKNAAQKDGLDLTKSKSIFLVASKWLSKCATMLNVTLPKS